MNKTIIININGSVFHIEEEAYEVLKNYMTEVKRHFAYSDDHHEIVMDIENRLAEMFSERLKEQGREVIVLGDVEHTVAAMGRPGEFEQFAEDASETESPKTNKSLYRDTDDKVIAGVCSGLGFYFNLEAKWVRLIFIVSTLVSGIGLLPYIILWIILPVAKSRQEKMAMKGEAITLQNLKRNFDEDVESGKGYKPLHSSAPPSQGNDAVDEIVTFLGRALKVVLKLIGLSIIIGGALALFALFGMLLFGLGFLDEAGPDFFPLNAINEEYRSQVFLSAFLLIVIPLIALLLFAVRVIFNRKTISRYGSFAMLILWLTGAAMGIYNASKIASEFREEARFEESIRLTNYPTLTLRMRNGKMFSEEDSLRYNIKPGRIRGRIIHRDDSFHDNMGDIDLFIEKSGDTTLNLVKEMSGRGKNFEQALAAAQRVNYGATQQDSVLVLDKFFSLTGNGLFRSQEVDIRLFVPVNTRIRVEGNLDWRLRNYNVWDCQPEDSDPEKEISEWIMTEEGLKCIDQILFERKRNH